jgi:Na+/proline symporter
VIAAAAALTAPQPGARGSVLGVFGGGLFASAHLPALAVGLHRTGGTRAGAVASIVTGLLLTLGLELGGFLRFWTLPGGVSVAGLTLVLSALVYLGVSALGPHEALDADVRAVMEA